MGLNKGYVIEASVPELDWRASMTVEGPKSPGEKSTVPLIVTARRSRQ